MEQTMRHRAVFSAAAIALLAGLLAFGQADRLYRFHHLHLNATDPQAAIEFYTSRFDCEKAAFAGNNAVWAQKSWLLFDKAASPPAW